MHLILSRARADWAERRAFEDALLEELRTAWPGPVLVVPHIYDLQSDAPAARRVADFIAEAHDEAHVVLVSHLAPRAARWTLAAVAGVDAARITALTGDPALSSQANLDALAEATGAVPGGGNGSASVEEAGQPPATERWYPVIDYERCVACKQCHDFCLFGVYAIDEADGVAATSPDNCKNGCPACSRVCPAGAIMFPHYETDPVICGAADDRIQARAMRQATQPADAAAVDDELDDLIDALDELDDG